MAICEEYIKINGTPVLQGILSYPEEHAPECAVLLCPPHPNFAGDMNNNVITELAKSLSETCVVLRFNYRGIGESKSALPDGISIYDYWQDVEENARYDDPLNDSRRALTKLRECAGNLPVALVGYSFGALMATMLGVNESAGCAVGISPPILKADFAFLQDYEKPCSLLAGDNDFACPGNDLYELAANYPDCVTSKIMDNEDHFFRGTENRIADKVSGWIKEQI